MELAHGLLQVVRITLLANDSHVHLGFTRNVPREGKYLIVSCIAGMHYCCGLLAYPACVIVGHWPVW